MQQPRRAAIGGRLLSDQFEGKIEIELADVHARECTLVNQAVAA
jgi:hypothetical protein